MILCAPSLTSTNFIAIPLRKDLDFMNIMKERLKTKNQLKSQPLNKSFNVPQNSHFLSSKTEK